jgi:hypothetical protein
MKLLKIDKNYTELVRKGQQELNKFKLNEMKYTIQSIVELLGAEAIPALAKINTKYPGSSVINVGGMGILKIKFKKERI